MEPPHLSIKQEPLDSGDSTCPDSQHSGESSSGCHLRSAGNGFLRGITKKDPMSLLAGGRKYSDHCEARASRPGKSRIPGRDHRRYYHEHWRAEYLMDFNAARHGMICMVCGSSLATLKLSTIKRHIRQKHAYSLTWSAQEKEVIMNSWDAHLGLEMETDGARESGKGPGAAPGDHELSLDGGRRRCRGPAPLPSRGGRRPSGVTLKSSSDGESQSLEQYLKQSLQSWFQSEFLMDYDPHGNRLFCMMCGSSLPSLNLDDIKRHVMEAHPTSLGFSPAEKGAILEAWNSRELVLGGEGRNAEDAETAMSARQDLITKQLDSSASPDHPTAEEGTDEAGPWDSEGSSPRVPVRGRDHRRYFQEHWRMEYLMDYNGVRHGLVCMVCGSTLATLKMSTIKRHIQQKHPDSTQLSHQVKALIVQEWNQKVARLTDADDSQPETDAEVDQETAMSARQDLITKQLDSSASPDHPTAEEGTDEAGPWDSEGSSPRVPVRGRDHRRYFQEHWRMEYLMDYNGVRHGLVCMVCGSTLATLKMSTIKRHIQQKHPDSTQLSHQVKALIVQEWNQKVARLTDADDSQPETDAEVDQAESRRVYKPPASPKDPPEDWATPKREEDTPGADRLALPLPSTGAASSTPAGTLSRRSQRRNYQPRWRVQYLMDYDEQKHGLICMVCGGTLATLKVSTIKRHILQVHRFSLEYTELEKQTILEAYGKSERVARRGRALGPKLPVAGLDSETQDIKPNVEEAGKMALGYKLSVCAV
ncbi:zinc finger translocation-associated protein isoform X2 [Ahaetulla prasina]|uniref:zinc finger translocation-associated protein isoform X2 n=1 Tax=Ahaetulla prasina TaxID=499056 RepID=UPI002649B58E|nr:zinc finger translocation-associated protein isoform X2 [Ahaetulla prasina]